MLTSRLPVLATAVLSLALSAGSALAQAASDPKTDLVSLYTLSVAIDICGDVDLSAGDEDRLDTAISETEGKLALTEEASAALYMRLSAAADNDKDGFCKEVVPTLKDAVAKLPD